MKVTLKDILPQAADSSYAIAGFNVFTVEWARAIIRAAEQAKRPVIIMTNRSMIEHLPPEFCGPIFSKFAEKAQVPVCVHLDHNIDYKIIQASIDNGFSSVMFDGAKYSFEENIAHSIEVRKMAHNKGLSVEGEVGLVRYTDMPETVTEYTDPQKAEEFMEKTKVDCLAISVGTTHRMESQGAEIQYDRIREIEERVSAPLVIHGTSGIGSEDLIRMKQTRIAKFNIGTILRQGFANSLREVLESNSRVFDIYEMTRIPYEAVETLAFELMEVLG